MARQKTGWKKQSKRKQQLPKNWYHLRKQALTRDKHQCQIQTPRCTHKATHVDHIQAGNNHTLENLRSACQTCHMTRTGYDGGKAPRKPKRIWRQPEQHPAYKKGKE